MENQSTPTTKPVWKKWWFWLIVVWVIGFIGSKLDGSSSGPVLLKSDFMYINSDASGAVAYKFDSDNKVMFISTALGSATSGKYKIDHATKTISFSNWDEALHPMGNCTYETSGDTIAVLVNQKGVRFRYEAND